MYWLPGLLDGGSLRWPETPFFLKKNFCEISPQLQISNNVISLHRSKLQSIRSIKCHSWDPTTNRTHTHRHTDTQTHTCFHEEQQWQFFQKGLLCWFQQMRPLSKYIFQNKSQLWKIHHWDLYNYHILVKVEPKRTKRNALRFNDWLKRQAIKGNKRLHAVELCLKWRALLLWREWP